MTGNVSLVKVYTHFFIYTSIAGIFGWAVDQGEKEKMTNFRDKSVLYRKEIKPGEESSW